ncbi:MAG: AhpC/TSA family protein, partial [Cytophagales bacterium]|nr:AhpC/TSA family protein [Cytophagales bacterium]
MKLIFLFPLVWFTILSGFSQPNSPQEVKPLHVGDSIPNINIKDLNENSVSLRDLIRERPTVIIFYRGGWCPFCNTHLSNLQEIIGRLKKKGVQLLAISGDGVGDIRKTKDKNGLSYELLSDPNLLAASAFGIAFFQNGNWK